MSNVNEALFQAELWLTIGARDDVRLWRQNSGKALVTSAAGTRAIRGAPTGACDLTGIVRPEGWRVEIEVKGPSYKPNAKRDKAQRDWAEFIVSSGGIYLFARYNRLHSMPENIDRVVYQLDVEIAKKRGTLLPQKEG